MLNCIATCPTYPKRSGTEDQDLPVTVQEVRSVYRNWFTGYQTRDQETWKTNRKLYGCDNAGHSIGCQQCQDSNAEQESVKGHRGAGTPPG